MWCEFAKREDDSYHTKHNNVGLCVGRNQRATRMHLLGDGSKIQSC